MIIFEKEERFFIMIINKTTINTYRGNNYFANNYKNSANKFTPTFMGIIPQVPVDKIVVSRQQTIQVANIAFQNVIKKFSPLFGDNFNKTVLKPFEEFLNYKDLLIEVTPIEKEEKLASGIKGSYKAELKKAVRNNASGEYIKYNKDVRMFVQEGEKKGEFESVSREFFGYTPNDARLNLINAIIEESQKNPLMDLPKSSTKIIAICRQVIKALWEQIPESEIKETAFIALVNKLMPEAADSFKIKEVIEPIKRSKIELIELDFGKNSNGSTVSKKVFEEQLNSIVSAYLKAYRDFLGANYDGLITKPLRNYLSNHGLTIKHDKAADFTTRLYEDVPITGAVRAYIVKSDTDEAFDLPVLQATENGASQKFVGLNKEFSDMQVIKSITYLAEDNPFVSLPEFWEDNINNFIKIYDDLRPKLYNAMSAKISGGSPLYYKGECLQRVFEQLTSDSYFY